MSCDRSKAFRVLWWCVCVLVRMGNNKKCCRGLHSAFKILNVNQEGDWDSLSGLSCDFLFLAWADHGIYTFSGVVFSRSNWFWKVRGWSIPSRFNLKGFFFCLICGNKIVLSPFKKIIISKEKPIASLSSLQTYEIHLLWIKSFFLFVLFPCVFVKLKNKSLRKS